VGAFGLAAIFGLGLLMTPALGAARERLPGAGRPFPVGWLGRAVAWVAHHRSATILIFVAATGALLVPALRVRISADPMDYINNDLPSLALRHEMASKGRMAVEPVFASVADRAAEKRLLGRIEPLVGAGRPFARVDSAARYPLLRLLGGAANPFRGKDGSLCVILYPSFNPYEGTGPQRLLDLMGQIRERGGGDVARISGTPVMFGRLLKLIGEDMTRVSVSASVVIVLLLALLVRRPGRLVAVLIPLAGGIVWMLGALVLFGQKLTAMSVCVMPLVVGLGIDYGVHIAHRLRDDGLESAVAHTGRAIIIASLTTAIAFFALCFSRDPGLRGMGLAAGTGIVACLVWSLFFLPALLYGSATRRACGSTSPAPGSGNSAGSCRTGSAPTD
jgi:hypothetical protein